MGSSNNGDGAPDDSDSDNLGIYPLALPLLAGPSAIMPVIAVNTGFTGELASTLTGYATLPTVMVATGIIFA